MRSSGFRPLQPVQALFAVLPLALLAGCGSAPSASAVPTVNLSGNWQFNVAVTPAATPTIPTNPIGNVFGALSFDGTKVTGILNVLPYGFTSCISQTADLAVTGTLDAAGNLTLSAPIDTGTLTLTLNVAGASNRYLSGSLQVKGGACAQAAALIDGYRVPPITGTFTGTLDAAPIGTSSGAAPSAVTVALTESTTPNADGQFPLSGTVISTGGCPYTFNFTGGSVAGDRLYSQLPVLVFGGPPQVEFVGAVTPGDGITARSILGGLNFLVSSPCAASAYSGSLVR